MFLRTENKAYYQLRHGKFTVETPDWGGRIVYEAYPNGDGMFDADERLVLITSALRNYKNY